jgi:GAF domain-containing protein
VGPPDNGISPARFKAGLAEILLSEETVPGLLEVVVRLAEATVTGVDVASVTLVGHDGKRLKATGAGSAAVRAVDEVQFERGAGPSVQAVRTGREVGVPLPAPRWAAFSAAASALGFGSVRALPLRVRGRSLGTLNLYSLPGHSLGGPALTAARALAGQAAVVLAHASSLLSAQMANRHLLDALESRDVIGQAKGILMARYGVTADQAFDDLRRTSQHNGRKLRDVAADVVEALGPPSKPVETPGDAA